MRRETLSSFEQGKSDLSTLLSRPRMRERLANDAKSNVHFSFFMRKNVATDVFSLFHELCLWHGRGQGGAAGGVMSSVTSKVRVAKQTSRSSWCNTPRLDT